MLIKKFGKVLAPLAIFLAGKFLPTVMASDQLSMAVELMAHISNDPEAHIELLRILSSEHKTIESISAKDLILALVMVSNKHFSDEIYQKYDITPEELPEILDIAPRFGASTATLNNMDPMGIFGGYGCWCRFGTTTKGRGKVQDDMDKLCKSVQQQYECLRLDILVEDGKFCDPKTVTYQYDMINYVLLVGGITAPTIADNCLISNQGDRCAIQTCELELGMILEFFKRDNGDVTFGSKINIQNNLLHSNGFVPADECVAAGNQQVNFGGNAGIGGAPAPGAGHGVNPADKQCCGHFPRRFPFNTLGGDRDCCDSTVFNTVNLMCCSGSVLLNGSCTP